MERAGGGGKKKMWEGDQRSEMLLLTQGLSESSPSICASLSLPLPLSGIAAWSEERGKREEEIEAGEEKQVKGKEKTWY